MDVNLPNRDYELQGVRVNIIIKSLKLNKNASSNLLSISQCVCPIIETVFPTISFRQSDEYLNAYPAIRIEDAIETIIRECNYDASRVNIPGKFYYQIKRI